MAKLRKTITEIEYKELVQKNNSEVNAWLKSMLSDDIIYGYGYYGCGKPKEENGEYFIEYEIGDSCD